MITFSIVEITSLAIAIGLGVLNVIQFQNQRLLKKETLRPIYNGLIGIFNDVKNKGTYWYVKRNLLFAKSYPYKTPETLKGNLFEFANETINHLENLREHIVPILKTIDPSEERVFKGVDFGLTDREKELRQEFVAKSVGKPQEEQEAE